MTAPLGVGVSLPFLHPFWRDKRIQSDFSRLFNTRILHSFNTHVPIAYVPSSRDTNVGGKWFLSSKSLV